MPTWRSAGKGPNLIGRPYDFKVVHILELLDELREQGRLKTTGKETQRLTYHDPCQIARRGGVVQQPRNLIEYGCWRFRRNAGDRHHELVLWCRRWCE